MNLRFFCSHLRLSAIIRRVAVMLVALAWSHLALWGEIHDAAKNGDLKEIEALLKDKPDPVFGQDSNGRTPLHLAASFGRQDVAELLLAQGAKVNVVNEFGLMVLELRGGFGTIPTWRNCCASTTTILRRG
ncbi:MAG: ankyrin repeat domain-containing protein [Limisphaerales bacterium]